MRLLSDILIKLPEVKPVIGVRQKIRRNLEASGKKLIVIDDDPTGTQTVYDVSVYTDWSIEQLQKALNSKEPVFYISTNSRSLSPEEARNLNYQLGQNLKVAAQLTKKEFLIASRSDSTLRGHFPYEVEALAKGLNHEFDGIIIVPALFEGGRYTIDDTQWVDYGEKVLSAEETEFAQDPVFGYRHGNLKLWVEEKTVGKVKAEEVLSVSIETIRGKSSQAITKELMKSSHSRPVIVNAACYEDLDIFGLGLLSAEKMGKNFIYRCAASFVKVRGGFQDKTLLTKEEIKPGNAPGLIVVGSYVEKTSSQLDCLLRSGIAMGVELPIDNLLQSGKWTSEIKDTKEQIEKFMAYGSSVAVYTSRKRKVSGENNFLKIGSIIMDNLCQLVRQIRIQPGFLIAKGGITSIEIARSALHVKKATVLGQIAEGVPVWKLDSESRWPGIPYIVFPGNVGDQHTLFQIVKILL